MSTLLDEVPNDDVLEEEVVAKKTTQLQVANNQQTNSIFNKPNENQTSAVPTSDANANSNTTNDKKKFGGNFFKKIIENLKTKYASFKHWYLKLTRPKRIILLVAALSPILIVGGVIAGVVIVSATKATMPELYITGNRSWFDTNIVLDRNYSTSICTLDVEWADENFKNKITNAKYDWKITSKDSNFRDKKIYLNKNQLTIEGSRDDDPTDPEAPRLPMDYRANFSIEVNVSHGSYKTKNLVQDYSIFITDKVPDFRIHGSDGVGAGVKDEDENYVANYTLIMSHTVVEMPTDSFVEFESRYSENTIFEGNSYTPDDQLRSSVSYSINTTLSNSQYIQFFSLSGSDNVLNMYRKNNYRLKIAKGLPILTSPITIVIDADAYQTNFVTNHSSIWLKISTSNNFPSSAKISPTNLNEVREISNSNYLIRSNQLVGTYAQASFVFKITGVSLSNGINVVWTVNAASSGVSGNISYLLNSPSNDAVTIIIDQGLAVNPNPYGPINISCTLRAPGITDGVYNATVNFRVLDVFNEDDFNIYCDSNNISALMLGSSEDISNNPGYDLIITVTDDHTENDTGVLSLYSTGSYNVPIVASFSLVSYSNAIYLENNILHVYTNIPVGSYPNTIRWTIDSEEYNSTWKDVNVLIIVRKKIPNYNIKFKNVVAGIADSGHNLTDIFLTPSDGTQEFLFSTTLSASEYDIDFIMPSSSNYPDGAFTISGDVSWKKLNISAELGPDTKRYNFNVKIQRQNYFTSEMTYELVVVTDYSIPNYTITSSNKEFNPFNVPNPNSNDPADQINNASNPYNYQLPENYSSKTFNLVSSIVLPYYIIASQITLHNWNVTSYTGGEYPTSNKYFNINNNLVTILPYQNNQRFEVTFELHQQVTYNILSATKILYVCFEILPKQNDNSIFILNQVKFLANGYIPGNIEHMFIRLADEDPFINSAGVTIMANIYDPIYHDYFNFSTNMVSHYIEFSFKPAVNSLPIGIHDIVITVEISKPNYCKLVLQTTYHLNVSRTYRKDGRDWVGFLDTQSNVNATISIWTAYYPSTVNGIKGTAYIEKCSETYYATNLVIPELIEDSGDIYIIEGFKNRSGQSQTFFQNILSINGKLTLADSIKEIGTNSINDSNIFSNTTNIYSIIFPSELTYISKNSFNNCKKLELLDFSKSSNIEFNDIFNNAFRNISENSFNQQGTKRKIIDIKNGKFSFTSSTLFPIINNRFAFFGSELNTSYWTITNN